ncbi:Fic family protein [Paracandidimonas soli]|uniref:Fic family protein n=1 Tax=Paracandidimonas soli TaxID=1917182 RepID=UPI00333E84A8
MARPIPEAELQKIEAAIALHPEGASVAQIADALTAPGARRTLQYRLRALVNAGRLRLVGDGRAARYHIGSDNRLTSAAESEAADSLPLSTDGQRVRTYVRQAVVARRPVGYDRAFLDRYRPNSTFYLTPEDRARLAAVGKPHIETAPAGTYAKQILSRLLIDLAWNSSRLEGNTYSLFDTRRLLDFGEAAEGRDQREAQMILNHKDAIEFLVASADEIGFNRYTVLNLHALLANNLLADPAAAGRLRHIIVGIDGSTFHPLEVPGLIEECFDRLLATAAAIEDPYEQALFVMVQLPYLQPFDDVNKRVSRLAANIPLIKANLVPLSFTDVPSALYTQAMLGVYEMNDTALLRDVFLWAYERSVARYGAVRQSLGEPDPFRLRYREALRETIRDIVRGQMDRKAARSHLVATAADMIPADDQDQFVEVVETELLGLHEGNFARYQVRPTEFRAWHAVWNPGSPLRPSHST